MVPAAFVTLPALPRTPGGKVDRRALPDAARRDARDRTGPYVAPRTPLEEFLAGLWREVLQAGAGRRRRQLLRAGGQLDPGGAC